MSDNIESIAERIERQDVHLNVTGIICALRDSLSARDMGEEASAMAFQAAELSAPFPDCEEAAIQAGWTCHGEDGRNWSRPKPSEGGTVVVDTAEGACKMDGLAPVPSEVYEFWAVSEMLADRLEAQGERVDRCFQGLNIWARTSTGQSLTMDAPIERIAREIAKAD